MRTIATHDGVFHADDVFACAALRWHYGNVQIVRTRDVGAVEAADIVVDVGGSYDPENARFDHHQRGGAGERSNGIPYAAFGLVWEEIGPRLCGGSAAVADEVDRMLVSVIDAIDNGIQLAAPVRDDLRDLGLSTIISWMNPGWDEPNRPQDINAAFEDAMDLAVTILARVIRRVKGSEAAKAIVEQAITDAQDPRIVVLPKFCPWQDVLVPNAPDALYVVYESFGSWRVQAVPQALGSFASRQLLPDAWAGLNGGALVDVTGVADATFCHKGRFIAGAASQDGAIALARAAL